ncbi:5188_t:CDS:2, partial [Racocetra persica]
FDELNIPAVAKTTLKFGEGKATFKGVKLDRERLTLGGLRDFEGKLSNDPILLSLENLK